MDTPPTIVLNPLQCLFTDDIHGKQCICRRCTAYHLIEGVKVCDDCGHLANAHPEVLEPKSTATSIIKAYRDGRAGLRTSTGDIKATKEDAATETNAGLRKKRKSASGTDTAPPEKKKKPSGSSRDSTSTTGKDVTLGKLVFLPGGLNKNGELIADGVPSLESINELKKHGLVLLGNPKSPIIINNSWDNRRMVKEVARFFPNPLSYLDSKASPTETQHWVALYRSKKFLRVASDMFPTGADLISHCTKAGQPAANNVLYLASKLKISPERQENWGAPLSEDDRMSEDDSDDLGSDIDTVPSEGIVVSPVKPRPKPRIILKNVVKIKKESVDSGQSDMKEAAVKRFTRLSGGYTKRVPTPRIPHSSDVEEEEDGVINVDSIPDSMPTNMPTDNDFPLFLSGSPRSLSSIHEKSPSPSYDTPPGSPVGTSMPFTSFMGSDLSSVGGAGSMSNGSAPPYVHLPHIPTSYAAAGPSMASWMTSVPLPLPFTPTDETEELKPKPYNPLSNPTIRFSRMGKGKARANPWANKK
ncbi:hypothetical protein GGX14DRAFT_403983 [Mycena pura]|uniref:Uncharacterized protein n=1 Tax=Mycena pura TaxID=153505 RepID=A0AAD6UVQ1_9AGAR|nr:hypothetical protein GGX14DRAFT_403983 [Mycena pura]